jgi:hypothetical protein
MDRGTSESHFRTQENYDQRTPDARFRGEYPRSFEANETARKIYQDISLSEINYEISLKKHGLVPKKITLSRGASFPSIFSLLDDREEAEIVLDEQEGGLTAELYFQRFEEDAQEEITAVIREYLQEKNLPRASSR